MPAADHPVSSDHSGPRLEIRTVAAAAPGQSVGICVSCHPGVPLTSTVCSRAGRTSVTSGELGVWTARVLRPRNCVLRTWPSCCGPLPKLVSPAHQRKGQGGKYTVLVTCLTRSCATCSTRCKPSPLRPLPGGSRQCQKAGADVGTRVARRLHRTGTRRLCDCLGGPGEQFPVKDQEKPSHSMSLLAVHISF